MDGRNPTPVDRRFIPLGVQPSKVVQDFFHPPSREIFGNYEVAVIKVYHPGNVYLFFGGGITRSKNVLRKQHPKSSFIVQMLSADSANTWIYTLLMKFI